MAGFRASDDRVQRRSGVPGHLREVRRDADRQHAQHHVRHLRSPDRNVQTTLMTSHVGVGWPPLAKIIGIDAETGVLAGSKTDLSRQ